MYHKCKSSSILSVALVVCVTWSGFAVGQTLAKGSILFTRNSELYAMGPDGTNVRQLLDRSYFVFESAWSPDGRRIAFVSGRDRNAEIYLMNVETGEIVNLTGHPARDRQPVWSPDGRHIAFVSNRDSRPFGEDLDIYVMNADGTDVRRLTNGVAAADIRPVDIGFAYREETPSWSPDGRYIVFKSDRHTGFRRGSREIYVINADGTNPRRLTDDDVSQWSPAWSPDGSQIAFQHGGQGIYVMDADGTNPRRLTLDSDGGQHPTWSPDGKQIAFQRQPRGPAEIFVINVDGTNLRNLTNHPENDAFPDWCPTPPLTPVNPRENKLLTWGWLKVLERRF